MKKKIKLHPVVLLSFLLVISHVPVHGQHGGKVYSSISSFSQLNNENGLTSNQVNDVLQDSQGYLWFATRNGLNRYDGYQFQAFYHQPNDSASLPVNDLNVLAEDEHGFLWIGTNNGGLCRFNPTNQHVTRFNVANSPNLAADHIKALYADQNGSLWIGTFGGGLVHLDLNTFTFSSFQHQPDNPASLSNNSVFAIQPDHNGSLWIATLGGGLCRFDLQQHTFKSFRALPSQPNQLPSDDLYSLFMDPHNILWIGTFGNGLVRFDPVNEQFLPISSQHPPGDQARYILDIEQDPMGNLWLASQQNGLIRFHDGVLTPLPPDSLNYPGLNPLSINALCLDKSGNLWLGSENNGSFRLPLNSLAFTNFIGDGKHIERFNTGAVMALTQDRNQHYWVGTFGNGLFQLDSAGSVIKQFRRNFLGENEHTVNDNFITALEETSGAIWMGTAENGLSKYDLTDQTFTHYNEGSENSNLSSNSIETIYTDSKGRLWIGTYGGGLCRYNENSDDFSCYSNARESSVNLGNAVKVIYEDSRGYLWIGTKASGLSCFNPVSETFINYRYDNQDSTGITSNAITGITETADGKIWVSTLNNGLCYLDTAEHTFSALTKKDGLVSNQTCGMLQDNDGNLWISTIDGLSLLTTDSLRFTNFGQHEGLYSEEFQQWSAYRDENGKLFFGGLENFLVIEPQNQLINNYSPPVYLTGVKLFNEYLQLDEQLSTVDTITLEHDEDFFEFEFVLLNYEKRENNRYAYRMEGFDKKWNTIATRRTASYTNLDAGSYTFRVKAYNEKKRWNDNELKITVIIKPAWYETVTFRIAVALVIIVSGIAYARYREQKFMKQKIKLQRMVSEKTAELVKRSNEIEEKNNSLNAAKKIIEQKNNDLEQVNNQLEHRVEQRTNELRKTNERLKNSNKELDMFIYRAYHDIKGPISSIEGLCKLARVDLQSDDAKAYIEMFDKSSQQAKRMLSRILSIYDIRNTKIEPHRIDVNAMLHEIIEVIKTRSEFYNFRVQTTGQHTDSFYNVGILMEISLRNILENAVRFSRHENDSFVEVQVCYYLNRVEVMVTDNGIGIPASMREKLFSMFLRGDTQRSGTGMGLFAAKSAVERLEGTINYEETANYYTRFTLVFPNILLTEQVDQERWSKPGTPR